jgi:hypothetical protein
VISESEFVDQALDFLRVRLGDRANGVNGDTELVSSGLLDSLLVLEFFLFLEDVRGSAIEPEKVSVDALSTVRGAYQLMAA